MRVPRGLRAALAVVHAVELAARRVEDGFDHGGQLAPVVRRLQHDLVVPAAAAVSQQMRGSTLSLRIRTFSRSHLCSVHDIYMDLSLLLTRSSLHSSRSLTRLSALASVCDEGYPNYRGLNFI